MPTGLAMKMAMEMGKAVTPTTADTASMATLNLTVQNENRKWKRRSEAVVSAVGSGD